MLYNENDTDLEWYFFKVIGKKVHGNNVHGKKVHPKMKKAEKTSTPGRKDRPPIS